MPCPHEKSRPLTQAQGEALVTLARQTLADHFHRAGADPARRQAAQMDDAAFERCCGVFVTLTLAGQLRGCIGSLTATAPLWEGVRDNALNAALRDPRFTPLTAAELDPVHIEVSVLSEPQPLAYHGADELLARLRPGVDGVIIKKGFHSATFLPQVWQQLPDAKNFLSHLCRKAGLPDDQWRREDLAVQTYQVQSFEEA